MADPMKMKQDENDFAAAFEEGAAVDAGEVTEEMAAGLDIEDALEDQAEGETEGMEGEEGDGAEQMMAAAPTGEAAMPKAGAMSPEELAKEVQRLKSWEGRLKARDAELKAREAGGGSGGDGADMAEAVTVAAEAVEQGAELDDVMATLSADFGTDFMEAIGKLIEAKASAIAERVAGEKVNPVMGAVEQLIGSLTDERQRNHFEAIADRHPDFNEVANNPAFQEWVSQQGEAAQSVVEGGSARQVIALLDQFKAAAGGGGEDMAAMQAAESVPARRGLTLPKQPAASDDYEAAWKEFA